MFKNWPDLTNAEVVLLSLLFSLIIAFLFKHPKNINNAKSNKKTTSKKETR